jgi:flagellar hook assembly protein FlgD
MVRFNDLQPVYPNPASDEVSIVYSLEKEGDVSLNLYNANGQFAEKLDWGKKAKGPHKFNFSTSKISQGMYYIQIVANGFIKNRSFCILR